ncbi:serine/threonine-protein kinase fused [Agrilus planipennis]|uniref:non-specific serine/threonine protein kinase n=1 Tax=Agrilus planipennis TaxID=224129 RepID=A0A1W4XEB3_AGRPL|nr:serine/threonine-protein kinase fused [Agrilus planipennis]
MDKYEVVGLLGEGSFGRVYKAKQISDSRTVALKVISKRGRSVKEIKGLRRECEIQRHLNHPNIIQMLDSFETDNEIVVITEFAHKELTTILSKEGYLTEDRVQAIVWDLASALYYLHSNRVLHRDLKPQNILLDARNIAKLCDFGFARNMSTGTHVLTSIKGTPLYMAPELIEEHPYDHSADLWSLGCIIYELLIGSPPFCTSSILHLIRMIRHEQIQWPTFLSEDCISFLKGLLHKNPRNRMTWPEILKHPFVEGHILITEGTLSMPLTRPMSVNTLQVKEQQRKDRIAQKLMRANSQENAAITTRTSSSKGSKGNKNSRNEEKSKNSLLGSKSVESNKSNKKTARQKSSGSEASKDEDAKISKNKNSEKGSSKNDNTKQVEEQEVDLENWFETSVKEEKSNNVQDDIPNLKDVVVGQEDLIFHEDSQPIENEEWMVFLRKTMSEIFRNELSSLTEISLANVLLSPLRNTNTNSKVMGSVASLFSMPFVILDEMDNVLTEIENVYNKIKLVPNLVNAAKVILKQKDINGNSDSGSSSTSDLENDHSPLYKDISALTEEDLEAIEYSFLLICNLVHRNNNFAVQFCDSVAVLNIYDLLRSLLSMANQRPQLVADLISILTQVLRNAPENWEVVDKILIGKNPEDRKDFLQLFIHSDDLIRERMCYLIHALGKYASKTFDDIWNSENKETLEALMFDSIENVRNAAEVAFEELKSLEMRPSSTVRDSLECEDEK